MSEADHWPFIPRYLSDVFAHGDLQVLLSGCSDRLGRPLTVLDYDQQTGVFTQHYDALTNRTLFEPFCGFFRNEDMVAGGNRACELNDEHEAQAALDAYNQSHQQARVFPCHMGLLDMCYVVRVSERPVGVLFSGQYAPAGGPGSIVTEVLRVGAGARPGLALREGAQRELETLAGRLPVCPAEALEAFTREGKFIEDRLSDHLREIKGAREREFLDELRRVAVTVVEPIDRTALRALLSPVLEKVRAFLHCPWVICFGSLREGDTVLAPVASAGTSSQSSDDLPHFNWRKAGLPIDFQAQSDWDPSQWLSNAITRGVRGANASSFANAGCIVPVAQDTRYRGALALGPFSQPVDLKQEARFLGEVANIVCSLALTALEVKYLQDERQRWQTTAELVLHQVGTGLSPIGIYVGWAKDLVKEGAMPSDVAHARQLLTIAERLVVSLSQGAGKTLAGYWGQLEAKDLHLEPYPLSVLVANSARGFAGDAQHKNRTLIVDPSVELLPWVEMDVSRLCIAIGNLLNNAIKYSFPGTRIIVRGRLAFSESSAAKGLLTAILEVQDTGHPVIADERDLIFDQGVRGRVFADGSIAGQGLGLWEAREVVRLHGGTIRLERCEPLSGGRAYVKVFEIRLPVLH